MPQVSRRFIKSGVKENIDKLLVESFDKAKDKKDIVLFLSDLLTPTERIMLAKRISIAFLLLRKDYDLRGISRLLKVSTNTVAKISNVLKTRGNGYRRILDKLLREEAFKVVLNELLEALSPVPPKGANWSRWHKERRKRREKATRF